MRLLGWNTSALDQLAGLVEERAEELARILVKEMGKRISEARAEVQITAAIARYYAENGEKFLASHKLDTSKGDTWIEYHALGVIVAVEQPDDVDINEIVLRPTAQEF
ncbi:aldehyde dehydrogenase family protein [Massilia sp. CFBP9026]|uniref:aldehyde dehydrogenase family protein n=1 Tax=Massilia sp. CFBP9026 TaxID=3096536 RepID=UPI002A6B84A7|nr:aldehyde dehydrogenase family protein [Massilia sp. CFBP9026]MDY0964799.1 aldehyde dehydrogenase family protein [Massilia sp. CFBP9026]